LVENGQRQKKEAVRVLCRWQVVNSKATELILGFVCLQEGFAELKNRGNQRKNVEGSFCLAQPIANFFNLRAAAISICF
jgi:hypothetical protein